MSRPSQCRRISANRENADLGDDVDSPYCYARQHVAQRSPHVGRNEARDQSSGCETDARRKIHEARDAGNEHAWACANIYGRAKRIRRKIVWLGDTRRITGFAAHGYVARTNRGPIANENRKSFVARLIGPPFTSNSGARVPGQSRRALRAPSPRSSNSPLVLN